MSFRTMGRCLQDVKDNHGWHDEHIKLGRRLHTEFLDLLCGQASERVRQRSGILLSATLVEIFFKVIRRLFYVCHVVLQTTRSQ